MVLKKSEVNLLFFIWFFKGKIDIMVNKQGGRE